MSFQKNTQTLAQNDPLWAISDGWKIAVKTGRPYFKLETILDQELGAAIDEMLASNTTYVIPYGGDYYVPIDRDGQILVYKFDSQDDADNFANYKPAAGFHPKAANTFTPKKQSNQWGGNTTVTSKPPYQAPAKQQPHGVTTFTDLEEVDITNKDRIRENERLGLRILPAVLVGAQNMLISNPDGKRILLMGKIINVQPIQQ